MTTTINDRTPELKPCPFCGGEAVIERDDITVVSRYLPVCSNYGKGCWGMQENWFISEHEAIEAWNRRVSDENNIV